MISDNVFNTKRSGLSIFMKAFKISYKVVLPFVVTAAIVLLLLCFFSPAEGSSSHIWVRVLCPVAIAVVIACMLIHRRLLKKSEYRLYKTVFTSKIKISLWLPIALFVLIIAVPFYTFAITSVKLPGEANSVDFTWLPKTGVTIAAYKELLFFEDVIGVSMVQTFLNTLVFAIIPTTVGLFVSALSAYGFSKLYFPGRRVLFNVFLFTLMVPSCVSIASSYVLFETIGWTESPLPVIIPGCFGSVGTVLFLKEYFAGISDEIIEAAKIDGAGKIKIFLCIVLPLGAPALTAQFMLGFMGACNNYMSALLYLTDPKLYTMPMALDIMSSGMRDRNLTAAGGMVTVIPMLILYAIFQKKIISGISMSEGLKG